MTASKLNYDNNNDNMWFTVCLFFHLFRKTNLKIEMIGNKIKFMEKKKSFRIKNIILINHKKIET